MTADPPHPSPLNCFSLTGNHIFDVEPWFAATLSVLRKQDSCVHIIVAPLVKFTITKTDLPSVAFALLLEPEGYTTP